MKPTLIKPIGAVAAIALAFACQKSPPAASSSSDTSPTAPARSFVLGLVKAEETHVQGCQTMVSRLGDTAGGDVFFSEAAGEPPAKGFIRIDNQLMTVNLATSAGDEKFSKRTFVTADKTLEVVESLKTLSTNEDSDSVDQVGDLVITYKGITQTFKVEGGTAC